MLHDNCQKKKRNVFNIKIVFFSANNIFNLKIQIAQTFPYDR